MEFSSQFKFSFGDGLVIFSFNVVFGQIYNLMIGVNVLLQGVYGLGVIDVMYMVLWNGMLVVMGFIGQVLGDYVVMLVIGLDYWSFVMFVFELQIVVFWVGGFLLLLGLCCCVRC